MIPIGKGVVQAPLLAIQRLLLPSKARAVAPDTPAGV